MADTVPFFDEHNDFLLRLMHAYELRQDIWLGHGQEAGHLDLARMQQAGFAGGLFAIFVPSPSAGSALSFLDAMAAPPYELPLPAPLPHAQAQPVALSMAGLLLWMQRVAPEAFAVCRSGAEVRLAIAENRIAGVMHLEGAEAIDPDLDRALPLS